MSKSDPPSPPTPMTRERAIELARLVTSGKCRSYVQAAQDLALHLLEEEHLRTSGRELSPAAEVDWYRTSFLTRLTADSAAVMPRPGSRTLGRRFRLIDVTRERVPLPSPIPHPGILEAHPDPFPPETPAPHAHRIPGEHYMPTVYRTNRPPDPEDARAMRTPPPSPLPQLNPSSPPESPPFFGTFQEAAISERPDPYLTDDGTIPPPRRMTPKSRASTIPHPPDSSGTKVFDFSPSNTPPLPSSSAQGRATLAPPPSLRVYCGECDHEHCTCAKE